MDSPSSMSTNCRIFLAFKNEGIWETAEVGTRTFSEARDKLLLKHPEAYNITNITNSTIDEVIQLMRLI